MINNLLLVFLYAQGKPTFKEIAFALVGLVILFISAKLGGKDKDAQPNKDQYDDM